MKFKVSEVRPNPWRDLEKFPLRPDRVEALKATISETGFWDNVLARLSKDGRPELAYGHHRLAAIRELYGDDHEIDLIVQDVSDLTMARIMADDNLEEFGYQAEAGKQAIAAFVAGIAAGHWSPEPPDPKTPKNQRRYAPSFLQGSVGADPTDVYTAKSLAALMGSRWKPDAIGRYLAALELDEKKALPAGTTDDLAPRYVSDVVGAYNSVHDRGIQAGMSEKEAAKAAQGVAVTMADAVKSGEASLHGSAEKMAMATVRLQAEKQFLPPTPSTPKPLYPHKVVMKLRDYLNDVLAKSPIKGLSTRDLLQATIENANAPDMWPDGPKGRYLVDEVTMALRDLALEATSLADRLEAGITLDALGQPEQKRIK
jgi:hypothetical protein